MSRTIIFYALAIGLVSGSNFFSVPILVKLLGTEEFARWALIEPIVLMGIPLALLGTQFGVLKRISREGISASNAISEVLPFALPGLALSIIVVMVVSAYMGLGALAYFAVAIIIFEAIILLSVSCLRAEGKAGLYAIVEGGRALLILVVLSAALFFISYSGMVTDQYMLLRAGAAALGVFVAIIILRPRFHPSFEVYKSGLFYGSPVVIGSIFGVGLLSIDRYFVDAYAENADVTSYVAHMKISMIIFMAITAPFHTWFAPEAIKRGADMGKNSKFFTESIFWFFAVVLWASANLWLVIPWAWPYIFSGLEFKPHLFAVLLVSAIAYSLGGPLSVGTLQPGKTKWVPVITGLSLLSMLLVGWIVVPVLGVEGAAIARAVGMSCYTILFAIGTVIILKIDFNWWGMASLVPLTGGAVYLSTLVAMQHDLGSTILVLIAFNCSFLILIYVFSQRVKIADYGR